MSSSKYYNVLVNKCPKCGKGDFFVKKSSYSIGFDKMNDHCSYCGQSFVPEPGFYQGALYISYAFYVAFIINFFLIYNYFFEIDINIFLISLIISVILLTPWFYRLARRTWLAIFIKN